MSSKATELDTRLETMVAELATMDIDARTETGVGETVTWPSRPPALDQLLARLETDDEGRFAIERTLGEGGMGVVHLAEQVALGRKVAIKTLRPGVDSTVAIQKVLQEAWITGYLEHPNVVPVYDIARGDDGRPVIVLKRIEGSSLLDLLGDPARLDESRDDPLEWAIQVCIQVCRALAHAHQHGIVHRDVKAENVMIGSHGEVYLLDWGIAVALADDGTGRFPVASDGAAVAGTPCYMAPEMLGAGGELGPWTDVYLVGGMLFEICTRRPPHEGKNLLAIMQSVLRSPPELPEDVPEELREIIRRAMALEPEERFESADAIRRALEGFLRHRGSRQLVERAHDAAQVMRAAIASGDVDAAEAAFAEARFGYRAALELWTENGEARRGLREDTEAMVRAALERGAAEAAGRLLASASDVDESLAREVAEARTAAEKKRAELAALEEDLDEERGRRTRTFLALLLGSIWVVAPLVSPLFGRARQDPANLFLYTCGMLGVAVALIVWARRSMTATRINRTLAGGLLGTMLAQVVITFVAWQLDMTAPTIRTLWMVLYMTGVLWMMASVTLALWPSALGYGLCAALAATVGREWVGQLMAVANGVLLINLLVSDRVAGLIREARRRHPPSAE